MELHWKPRSQEAKSHHPRVSQLGDRIRSRIVREGPLSYRDWMEACLYDPDGGYYMRAGRKTGPDADADFATSPTLHPFMGTAVAKEAADVWRRLGKPDKLRIAEFGGGEGDLARAALQYLRDHEPDLDVAWTHIEVSPAHREMQASADSRIAHAERMPDGVHLVVAHEFVDALPFHVLEWRKGNWAEVYVKLRENGFEEILGVPSRSAIEAAPKRHLEDRQRVVSMADAQVWLDDVAQAMDAGRILIIDYGDRGHRLWVPERVNGTVRGFMGQQVVEPLQVEPGECDITASVDFTQLEQWTTFEGFKGTLQSQEAFLVEHGVLEELAGAPRDTLADASEYLRLKQMVLPQAMGYVFKVLRLDRGISNGQD